MGLNKGDFIANLQSRHSECYELRGTNKYTLQKAIKSSH